MEPGLHLFTPVRARKSSSDMVAMILALFGKIDSNGVVGILRGIAGYVLRSIHKACRHRPGLSRDAWPSSSSGATQATFHLPHFDSSPGFLQLALCWQGASRWRINRYKT